MTTTHMNQWQIQEAAHEARTEAKFAAFMTDIMEVFKKHKATMEVRDHSRGYGGCDPQIEIDFEAVSTEDSYNTSFMDKWIDYKS
jgi:hypothetical protein